jgi:single-strand DNA-binding protein
VVVWGKQAENCSQYLSKGRQVYVEGRLRTRQWDDKDGNKRYTTEIVAQTVQFLGGRGGESGRERPAGERTERAPRREAAANASEPPEDFGSGAPGGMSDDEIPF